MTRKIPPLDDAFRALAEPSRRAVLDRLAHRPLSVSQLTEGTGLTRAALLQHVQVLQRSGLVTTRKVGRVRMCAVRPDGLAAVEGWLSERRLLWERRLDALGEVLDGMDGEVRP